MLTYDQYPAFLFVAIVAAVYVIALRSLFVLFSGDSTNSAAGLPVFRKLMTELPRIAPTYAVQGNWDVGASHARQLFDGTGVKELTARAGGVVMNLRGNKIWLGGASAHRIEGVQELLTQAPTDAFRIFVYWNGRRLCSARPLLGAARNHAVRNLARIIIDLDNNYLPRSRTVLLGLTR